MKSPSRILLAGAALVVAGLMTAGCRSIKIVPATASSEGLRFYRPWPYLMVTPDGARGCVARIIWLPRINQEYSIETTGFLGNVTLKPVLADGWNLTSFEGSVDSKIPETLGAIAAVAATGVRKLAADDRAGIEEGLYVFELDSSTGLVTNLKHVWPTPAATCGTLVEGTVDPGHRKP
jgi:hypothetical protein